MPSHSQTNPSMASIFTSAYPATNGVETNGLDVLSGALPTLAGILANDGYNTAALYSSKSQDPEYSGFNRGFQMYQPVYVRDPLQTDQWRMFEGHADLTTNAALSWLGQKPASPFFLWIHYEDPHYPYTPPAPFDTMYDRCDSCLDGSYSTIDKILAGSPPPDGDIANLKALYDGEISYTDQELGRFLAGAQTFVDMDNTMVIVTADEGQSIAENGVWFHPGILYNTVIRAPLIISYPNEAPKGRVVNSLTRHYADHTGRCRRPHSRKRRRHELLARPAGSGFR